MRRKTLTHDLAEVVGRQPRRTGMMARPDACQVHAHVDHDREREEELEHHARSTDEADEQLEQVLHVVGDCGSSPALPRRGRRTRRACAPSVANRSIRKSRNVLRAPLVRRSCWARFIKVCTHENRHVHQHRAGQPVAPRATRPGQEVQDRQQVVVRGISLPTSSSARESHRR